MAEPNALFLAVADTRRRGVVDAAARIVRAGGRASVAVGDPDAWRRDAIDPRVHVLALSPPERRRAPMRIEHGLLYAAPGVVLRAAGGAVREAYVRRVADRVHRRLVLPALRRVFGDIRHRLLLEHVTTGHPIDLMVIADAPSILLATRLLASLPPSAGRPAVTFSVEDALPTSTPAGPAGARAVDSGSHAGGG